MKDRLKKKKIIIIAFITLVMISIISTIAYAGDPDSTICHHHFCFKHTYRSSMYCQQHTCHMAWCQEECADDSDRCQMHTEQLEIVEKQEAERARLAALVAEADKNAEASGETKKKDRPI